MLKEKFPRTDAIGKDTRDNDNAPVPVLNEEAARSKAARWIFEEGMAHLYGMGFKKRNIEMGEIMIIVW